MKRVISLIWLWLFLTGQTSAQPVASEKRVINGLEIFPDLKDRARFYYGPRDIKLDADVDGKPRFQLLQMRYTGSGVYDDRGSHRFFNVVQLGVIMEPVSNDALKAVKAELGVGRIDLRPLSIKSVDAVLVAAVKSAGGTEYKHLGKDGSFQAESDDGTSNRTSYWTERTFTLKLEPHEAQLLWDQVVEGQLALSLAYSFSADLVRGRAGDIRATENRVRIKEFGSVDSEHVVDTIASTHSVKASAFAVHVDVQKWPDLIKKIDLNEGVPPAYAALEVRCYDFIHELRPDLAFKVIDIEATGVSGRPVKVLGNRFKSDEPDLYTLQIRFPYAVKLSEPFRYRVTEFTREGARQMSEWKTADSWVSSLDISTPVAERRFEWKKIELEARFPGDNTYSRVDVLLHYLFRQEQHVQRVTLNAGDELPIRVAQLTIDNDAPVFYNVIWTKADGGVVESGISEYRAPDDYLFLDSTLFRETGEN